ncbi:MAG: GDP-mannose 4,6-dehydratase [Candidatus Omnitrophica bacterium]|nr:GDP-mannose 4,6-dehydratase [Candidatus Omnitrophota bacterium]
MRFLVTGGCGFIGSHLVARLVNNGHYVTILDDLSTGSLDNVVSFLTRPQVELFIDTILNASLVEELVRRSDFVYHLAAVVGVKKVLDNPIESILVNVHGTNNVLKSCTHWHRPLLLTSTSEIYGKNTAVPFTEDADIIIGTTTKRRWSYACTKALDEFLAFAYAEEEKLKVIIVRLFNTVGPGQSPHYGMVLPRFVKQALAGQPLTVFGDGQQTRCFLHVDDALTAMEKLASSAKAYGEVFNVGSQEEVTIGQLAHLVKELTCSPSEIIFLPPEKVYPVGFEDMGRRVPDISKLTGLTGFQPKKNLRDIVTDTIAYFRSGKSPAL